SPPRSPLFPYTTLFRSRGSAGSRYRANGGDVPTGHDVDHSIDLQLGGPDTLANMSPLDRSVNRSLGPQIAGQLRSLPPGTCVVRSEEHTSELQSRENLV